MASSGRLGRQPREVNNCLALLPCLKGRVRKYYRKSSASILSYNNDLWPSILILFRECIGCIVGLIGTEEPFCITIMSISGRQVEDEVCHLLPLPADLLSSSPDCSSLDEVMDTPAIPDRVMLSRRDMRRGANQRYRVHHVVLQLMHIKEGEATAGRWSGRDRGYIDLPDDQTPTSLRENSEDLIWYSISNIHAQHVLCSRC